MTGLRWYAHEMEAYEKKTRGLTMIQHGAYRLLLDEYYSTGKPLPADISQLHRVCRAVEAVEKEAVEYVLHRFFTKRGEVFRHHRADQELRAARKLIQTKSKAGKAGAEARWQAHTSAIGRRTTDGCATDAGGNAHLPVPVTLSKKDNSFLNENGAGKKYEPGSVTIPDPFQRVAIFQRKLAAFIGPGGHEITMAAMNLDHPRHAELLQVCREKTLAMGKKGLPKAWPLQHLGSPSEARELLKAAADRMRARDRKPNLEAETAA